MDAPQFTPAPTARGAPRSSSWKNRCSTADLILDAETLARIDAIDEAIPNPMTEDGLRRL